MPHLVDTNLLLREAQPQHPMNAIARAAVKALRDAGEELFVTPQVLMEYWNVATRPLNANGLGFTPEDADWEMTELERLFRILPETPAVYPQWRRLVVAHGVSGRQVHDAHLVASMLTSGVTQIFTFNDADFRRYTEITVVHPSAVPAPDTSA